jgi:glycosyltransferase involved in cell wall biosynthesis
MLRGATVYVVAVNPRDLELSFIRPHVERLAEKAVAIDGYVPSIAGRPVLSSRPWAAAWRKLSRAVRRREWNEEIVLGYERAFAARPAAVLAEFGPTAARLVEPCRRTGLPLIAHFHGYDISVRSVIDEHRDAYQQVFRNAAAIIAVSRSMRTTLIDMGAPEERVHYCPYGVDCDVFSPGDVAASAPTVVAVGRFVDKKAPHLTILAFAEALRRNPAARLRMIGDGALFGSCVDLVSALGLEHAVTFLGQQPRDVIAQELRHARCFAQHSVQAWNGDSEGTPNTVLEACASGVPVVSTRHAGIPDVITDGQNGYLVDERDVAGMARALSRLLDDAPLAAQLGRAARRHVASAFAIERRIAQLRDIIEGAIAGTPPKGGSSLLPATSPALDSTPH